MSLQDICYSKGECGNYYSLRIMILFLNFMFVITPIMKQKISRYASLIEGCFCIYSLEIRISLINLWKYNTFFQFQRFKYYVNEVVSWVSGNIAEHKRNFDPNDQKDFIDVYLHTVNTRKECLALNGTVMKYSWYLIYHSLWRIFYKVGNFLIRHQQ